MEPMKPMTPMEPMKPMPPMEAPDPWWPAELGEPSTTGGQDDVRYAVFADRRRVAVSRGGDLTVYDTGTNRINGVAQDRGDAAGDLTFTGPDGDISPGDLKAIG